MSNSSPSKPLIAVSLKMYFGHSQTLAWARQVSQLAQQHPATREGLIELAILPSFPSLVPVVDLVAPAVSVGAQDVAATDAGPFTGEVSAAELAEIGCIFTEIGHAERRKQFGETDEIVGAKIAQALQHGLTPLICVGEPDRVLPAQAAELVTAELERVLAPARALNLQGNLVLAYEPHWAIGAQSPASIAHITVVCTALSTALRSDSSFANSRVIYGGSAGPGLLTELGSAVDGLFLGRFAHEVSGLESVLDDALKLIGVPA